MNREYHTDRIERGRMAAAGAGFVKEFVSEARENLITGLVGLYRAGTLTHDQAIGSIGGIAALDRLMNDLNYAEQQGVTSAEKEFGNA